MAGEPHGVPTYPVWVGSLKETVKEKDLQRLFSKDGTVASCKIMRDEQNKSRRFGYVNFYNEAEAEAATRKKEGFKIQGCPIKTKGPRMLREQGYFLIPQAPVGQDYRPLTDCSFFLQGTKCKRGKNCPYRHSEAVRSSAAVCPQWLERQCSNIHCPMKHPGGKHKPSDHQVVMPGIELVQCGGRCGDVMCAAHFPSSEALQQHVQVSRLPSCRYCQAFFYSDREYQDHMRTCRARRSSASTDTTSESADIEILSDTGSELESVGENSEDGENKRETLLSQSASSYTTPSPVKRGSTSSTASGGGGYRKVRSTSRSGARLTPNGQGSPELGLRLSGSSAGFESFGVGFANGGGVDSDSDSFYSGEEGDELVQYTPSEMARLLSLNEQDMVLYDSESDGEEGEGEGEGLKMQIETRRSTTEGSETATGEVVKKKLPSRRRRSKQRELSQGAPPTHPPPHHPHMGQLEPVGLFWDIENCSVPLDKSAFALATKMRKEFFEGKREAEFMCVCDITKERKEVTDSLHKAHVTLVHVNATAKNAADDKLRQSLRRFAHTYPAPSTVVLISGDVNFSPELNDLRHVHNITIILVHNLHASDPLKVFAHKLICYEEFLQDVEAPKEPQKSLLPRVVVVSGLPPHIPTQRLSSRLDRLSDNCGGKVLSVHPPSGTARVLFRTPEWAMKAQKRMGGEDVFGSKITCTLEYTPPDGRGLPRRLSGPNLSKSFPPGTAPSPPPQRPPPQLPPPGPFYPPVTMPPPPRAPFPHPHPPRPLLVNIPPRMPPPRPGFSPPLFHQPPHPYPRPPPPQRPPIQAPYPPPSGKILIYKIPPLPEDEIPKLNGQVVSIRLAACVKAHQLILWHSYCELQVLLKLDFLQTASVRKEEMVLGLYERGELRPQVVEAFMETCAQSIAEACRHEGVRWEVTTCGWSEDDEQDRITRSQVIALLRCYRDCWVRWDTFKEKYSKTYSSAISEMAIHNACKGAVQILGNAAQQQSQVIVFYELSPLIRIVSQPVVPPSLQKKLVKLLQQQPSGRIKLLNIVRAYREVFGPLPMSSNLKGKMLQDILKTIPNVTLVGNKPSNVYVTLAGVKGPGGQSEGGVGVNNKTSLPPRVPQPLKNISEIAGEFKILLSQFPDSMLPLSQIQQEYQTFFHHSFRVSDYLLSEGAKLRGLLEACEGIELVEIPLTPSGRMETYVCIKLEPPQLPRPASSSSSASDAGSQIPPESIRKFRQDCTQILTAAPNHKIAITRFPETYYKHFGQQFLLAVYGAKKLSQLLQTIPEVVRVTGEGTDKVMELIDTKEDCENKVEFLLYNMPLYQVSLDRFMREYEKRFGEKMTSYYGHPKLISLLEDFPNTVEISGKGPTRVLTLLPLCVFACEMRELLTAHPLGLPINKIVPAYKERFGRDFNVSQYGHSKLIRALEAIPDIVEIKGTGPTRVTHLKTSRKLAPSPLAADSAGFRDEVTAILMSSQGLRMAVNQFTKMYNTAFRKPSNLFLVTSGELVEAVSRIPVIKLGDAGPTQYIQLVPEEATGQEHSASDGDTPPPLLSASPKPQRTGSIPTLETFTEDRKPLEAAAPQEGGMAKLGPPIKLVSKPDVVASRLDEKEMKRLCSETHRLLLMCQEHAMTLAELVGCFREAEDPATPTAEELYLSLKRFGVKGGVGGGKPQNNFQISYIAGSVGDSMVQLNPPDCIWKLSRDLLFLFVHHPSPDFTMPLSDMLSVYAECYGHKLMPAVYAGKSIQQVMKSKQLNKVIMLESSGVRCVLTDSGRQSVLAALVAELLFLRGQECVSLDLLLPLYQEHFGVPLHLACFGVDSVAALLQLPEVATIVQIASAGGTPQPVLTQSACIAEQLRLLLTKHGGRLPLNQLEDLYLQEFGKPRDTDISHLLEKKLLHIAPHIVNLSSQKWAVWAPTGRPYPPRGSKVISASCMPVSDEGDAEGDASEDLITFSDDDGAGSESVSTSDQSEGPRGEDQVQTVPPQELKGFGSVFAEPEPKEGGQMVDIAAIGVLLPDLTSVEVDLPPPLIPTDEPLVTTAAYNAVSSAAPLYEDIDSSPYGFLAKEPELLAQLSSTVQVTEEDHLQPSSLGFEVNFGLPEHTEIVESMSVEGGGPSSGKVDYAKLEMTPDEVLLEFHKLKESEGGILNLEKMEPFLNYFGELSGRELERIESLKKKTKSSKAATRKKRVIAIRFPGQGPPPPPDPFEEQYRKSMEQVRRRLPEAPDLTNLSSSSDEEPIDREAYVKKLLEQGLPKLFSSDEEETQGDSSRNGQEKPDESTLDVQPKPLLDVPPSEAISAFLHSATEPFDWPELSGASRFEAKEVSDTSEKLD